jgi:hypothetical protein
VGSRFTESAGEAVEGRLHDVLEKRTLSGLDVNVGRHPGGRDEFRHPLENIILVDAREQYRKAVELRWALVEQAEGSIPIPLLLMVVGWLVLIFGSFGYRAPQNAAVLTSFVLASALISGALI